MVFLTRDDAAEFMVRYRTFRKNMLQSFSRRHQRSMRRLKRLEGEKRDLEAAARFAGKLGRIHKRHGECSPPPPICLFLDLEGLSSDG